MKVGLVGYGGAGRGIHTPLLREAGLTVTAVVTANPERVKQVAHDLPDAVVVPDLDALLAEPSLDLVVLATASGVHAEQAHQVIAAGLPLVVDKPMALDASAALDILDAAADAGVPLTVFQNRRFDAEHAAARETVRSGALGQVFRHEFRWERWRPEALKRWREMLPADQGGGILLDLHTHMVDAAVDLFGQVVSVYAELAARTTVAEDDAFLACRHESGVVSHLGATSLAGAPGPRQRILGTRAAFLLNHFERDLDVYPDLHDPDVDHCGFVYAGADRTAVQRPDAGPVDFYRSVVAALQAKDPQGAMPVDPHQAVHTLAVIDAARVSGHRGGVVEVLTPGQVPP